MSFAFPKPRKLRTCDIVAICRSYGAWDLTDFDFYRDAAPTALPVSVGGGEGFFEDGLEEVSGVGARARDLLRQQSAA